MIYLVYLKDKKSGAGDGVYFSELDFIPVEKIKLCSSDIADDLGLCKNCSFASRTHIFLEESEMSYQKLCPVLFHDMIHPEWTLEEIV